MLSMALSAFSIGSKLFGMLSSGMKVAVVIALISGAVITYGVWRQGLINQGRQEVINEIAARNEKILEAGREAASRHDDCIARGMRWSTVTGRCSGK